MKVEFPVHLDGKVIFISNEVSDPKEAFKFIAVMQEMFSDLVCTRNGHKSECVRLRVREDEDENEFYEAYCYSGDKECYNARKAYGVYKDKKKGLFQKIKDDKENTYLPNNGWMLWNKEKKVNE